MICFYMIVVNGKKVFGGKAWTYEDCLRYCERNEISVDRIECIGGIIYEKWKRKID